MTRCAELDAVGYAVQVKVNAFSAMAYWRFNEEFGEIRETLADALVDREEALDYGHHGEHLRVVAVTVVVPPDGEEASFTPPEVTP